MTRAPRNSTSSDAGLRRSLDRFALYERCVQSPADTARLLDAIHSGKPRMLLEDFAGTAALSRAWIARQPRRAALAIDLDPDALSRAKGVRNLRTHVADLLAPGRSSKSLASPAGDLLWVGNFSIGEIHSLTDLRRYLRSAHARLSPGGVFVCDLYHGPSAWKLGTSRRILPLDHDRVVEYRWRQISANRRTRIVRNAIDFIVRAKHAKGPVLSTLTDAFTYHWKLWSPRTLRAELRRAGFASTQIYPPTPDALDHTGEAYVSPRTEREASKLPVILIAARVAS